MVFITVTAVTAAISYSFSRNSELEKASVLPACAATQQTFRSHSNLSVQLSARYAGVVAQISASVQKGMRERASAAIAASTLLVLPPADMPQLAWREFPVRLPQVYGVQTPYSPHSLVPKPLVACL